MDRFEYGMADALAQGLDAANAKLQVVAVGIVEINRPLQRRAAIMLDRTAQRMIRGAELAQGLIKTLRRDADADARRGARRSSGADAWEMQADDVIAGEHIGLARAAVGVAPRGLELQAEQVEVKRLIDFQIAHRNRDVVDGLNAKTNFCNHQALPPKKTLIRRFVHYSKEPGIVNRFSQKKINRQRFK